MAPKRALPEGKSRRALVRVWQKEKKARGLATSPEVEPSRGCPRGNEWFPDLTPAKSCRALIRMKQRELTRRQGDVEGESNIPHLPDAGTERLGNMNLEMKKTSELKRA